MPERDFVPILALPNNRFGDGHREAIWKYVSEHRNSTIESLSHDLKLGLPFVRKRVDSMVADLKLFPADFSNDHFKKKSTIKSVIFLVQRSSPAEVAKILFKRSMTVMDLYSEEASSNRTGRSQLLER